MPDELEDAVNITDLPPSNPVLGSLVDTLRSGGKLDPMALLAQLGPGTASPEVDMLLQLLQQNREPQVAESEAGPDEESEEQILHFEASAAEEKAEAERQLQETVAQIYVEIESMRQTRGVLAAALGACAICFGEDLTCEECDGHGVPGSLAPEPAAFRKYVLPAYSRAKAIEAKKASYRPTATSSSHPASAQPPPRTRSVQNFT